jgi:hypothetical protein
MSLMYLPFITQGLIMGVDEYLHHKRGLGSWERVGHPLDTLTVFAPLSLIAFNDYSEHLLSVYITLAIISCLFITKDEFIHATECSPFENWLHSVLFILHPIIFLCSGLIWKNDTQNDFLVFQVIFVGLFMIYQIFRWSITWKKIK